MQIEIKISYDPAQETLNQALEALSRKVDMVDKSVEKTNLNVYAVAQDHPAAPAKEEAPAPEVKPDELLAAMSEAKSEKTGTKTDPVTKTDIRAIATAISKAGKKQELKDALESFGATKLSDIAEADYPALKQKLEAINA